MSTTDIWRFLTQQSLSRKASNRVLYEQAQSDCQKIIAMIVAECNPKRVYQWGSLLHPEQFDENSDIDIAIEGLKNAEAYFFVLGRAMPMTSFPLDIVEIEKVHPLHLDSITQKGKLIYERV
ncbi:MAG: nucleotidyltransferase domain-containing protein [Thermoguttaceae bacterium]